MRPYLSDEYYRFKVKTVKDHQCISCMACSSEVACPVAKTVELRVGQYEIEPMDKEEVK
jgi:formate hydrogenlyase subunit 6/NADH:ubiquinone oxidoreductase subunit I